SLEKAPALATVNEVGDHTNLHARPLSLRRLYHDPCSDELPAARRSRGDDRLADTPLAGVKSFAASWRPLPYPAMPFTMTSWPVAPMQVENSSDDPSPASCTPYPNCTHLAGSWRLRTPGADRRLESPPDRSCCPRPR